jgi:membrane protease YdiL (CAAX protease family)
MPKFITRAEQLTKTIQSISTSHSEKELSQAKSRSRLVLFIVFLICEGMIIILGSNYFEIFPTNKNLAYNLVIAVVFLLSSMWLKRIERWNHYWRIAYAFFIGSVAFPSTLLLDKWINRLISVLGFPANNSPGLAIEKICEMMVIVVPILLLTKLSGSDLGSIYLKRGNLKLGLGVGLLVFLFLATAAFTFGAQRFTSLNTLSAAVVWGLIFSTANGFMEELWLRGIFLKRFEPILGINLSVLLTSIVFALMHGFAFYFIPAALPFFVLNTLALGVACGYLMMKSDSVWGSTLIHTASDFFLFLAVLANA